MTRSIRLLLRLVFLSCVESADCQQSTANIKVDVDLAHRLAVSTLTKAAHKLPGMRYDADKSPHNERFYWFEITAQTPTGVSPLLGYYAVNKAIGDVWDPVACTRLSSSFIRSTQIEIRRSHGGQGFPTSAIIVPCEP